MYEAAFTEQQRTEKQTPNKIDLTALLPQKVVMVTVKTTQKRMAPV